MTGDVVVTFLHAGTVRAEFCTSLAGIVHHSGAEIAALIPVPSGPNLTMSRNNAVRAFLDGTDAPWLLMLDTDMSFPADLVPRLLAAADPAGCPVLSALCWKGDLITGETTPVLYYFTEHADGTVTVAQPRQWPGSALVRVDGTGAACLLVHREALLAVEKHADDPAAPWFRETSTGRPMELMSEDLTFCRRLGAAGIPVHVHTGIRTGHVKTLVMTGPAS